MTDGFRQNISSHWHEVATASHEEEERFDDHALIRQLVRSIVESYPPIQIVGEAGDGFEALQSMDQHRPRLVIMEVHMPNMNAWKRPLAPEVFIWTRSSPGGRIEFDDCDSGVLDTSWGRRVN